MVERSRSVSVCRTYRQSTFGDRGIAVEVAWDIELGPGNLGFSIVPSQNQCAVNRLRMAHSVSVHFYPLLH